MGGKSREKNEYIIRRMSVVSSRSWLGLLLRQRLVLALLVMVAISGSACGGRLFGPVYEYEEDIYLSLDGSAEVTINASVPALVSLRGMDLPIDPAARLDLDHLRAAYTSPQSTVMRVSRPWRRHGRSYVQVRVRVADIRKLTTVAPFSWGTYELADKDGLVVYKETIGAAALRPGTLQNVGWTGGERVAFRLHLPSKIEYHNARDLETNEPSDIGRGNILSWEQLLTERLDGRPINIEVRMDRQSILYHTLWLFAGAFTAAVLLIGILIWWTMSKAPKEEEAA